MLTINQFLFFTLKLYGKYCCFSFTLRSVIIPHQEIRVRKIKERSVKNCGVFEERSDEFPQFSK